MKKIISKILLILAITLINTQTFTAFAQKTKAEIRKEKKETKKQTEIDELRKVIQNKRFSFIAERINARTPTGNGSLAGEYRVDVRNDSLECYLPYFGSSTTAQIGKTTSPFDFKSQKLKYSVTGDVTDKKGQMILIEAVPEDNNNYFTLMLEVMESGSTTLTIRQRNGEGATYYGTLIKLKESK